MTRSLIRRPIFFLFTVLFIQTGLWFVYPHEFIASDPWAYSYNAFKIEQDYHQFFIDPPNHPFVQRLGVTLPVAFFYKVFGVNKLSTDVWPLCASLIIIVSVYAALPTKRSKVFGVFFCLSSITLFQQSIALFPDIICTAFMALSSLFLFYRQKTLEARWYWWVYPVSSIVSLFIAFLAKESAYWLLPLLLYAFILDIYRKDYRIVKRFYLPVILLGIILGLMYLEFSYLVWHHPLARLISVQQLTGDHLWSWKDVTWATVIERFTIAPVKLFRTDYGMIAAFALLSIWVVPKTHRFWVYYTLFTVFLFWFGSTSLTSYQPLPVKSRMALPALPGVYIVASLVASHIFVLSARPQRVNKVVGFLMVIVIAVPFLKFIDSWREITLPEDNAMNIVKAEVLAKNDRRVLLICSDTRSPEALAFYFGYKYPRNLGVQFAGDITSNQIKQYDEAFIFVDENRSSFLKSAYDLANFDEPITSIGLSSIYKEGSVLLFQTSNLGALYTGLKQGMLSEHGVGK